MSFWEEFGQRITKESRKALQRTRDLASVVSMNADISDSKRKINDLYAELGQLLVKEAFEGVTAEQLRSAISEENAVHEITLSNWQEIYSKVMFIRSEEEVIALNESKIGELTSESKCPECGKVITKGMLFCPACGTKLAQPEEAADSETPAEAAAPAPAEAAPEEAPAAATAEKPVE